MLEKDVQNAIMLEHGGLEDRRLWRHNVGVARPLTTPERVVRYGIPGQSDLFGVLAVEVPGVDLPLGVLMCVECKSATGKEQAKQARWGGMVRTMGGIYVVGRSPEDVTEGIESWRQERGL